MMNGISTCDPFDGARTGWKRVSDGSSEFPVGQMHVAVLPALTAGARRWCRDK
jgi:hypothetical protein